MKTYPNPLISDFPLHQVPQCSGHIQPSFASIHWHAIRYCVEKASPRKWNGRGSHSLRCAAALENELPDADSESQPPYRTVGLRKPPLHHSCSGPLILKFPRRWQRTSSWGLKASGWKSDWWRTNGGLWTTGALKVYVASRNFTRL